MSISPEEAKTALDTVRRVEVQTQQAISGAGGGQVMVIWGVVWIIGNLGTHLINGRVVGTFWGVLDLLGIIATLIVVRRMSRNVRVPASWRVGAFWAALLGYTVLWLWFSRPLTHLQLGLLITISMMFGYVVMGIWLDRVFLWVGLGITTVAAVGYSFVPDYFWLLMASLGGGALCGCGIYVQRRWR